MDCLDTADTGTDPPPPLRAVRFTSSLSTDICKTGRSRGSVCGGLVFNGLCQSESATFSALFAPFFSSISVLITCKIHGNGQLRTWFSRSKHFLAHCLARLFSASASALNSRTFFDSSTIFAAAPSAATGPNKNKGA